MFNEECWRSGKSMQYELTFLKDLKCQGYLQGIPWPEIVS